MRKPNRFRNKDLVFLGRGVPSPVHVVLPMHQVFDPSCIFRSLVRFHLLAYGLAYCVVALPANATEEDPSKFRPNSVDIESSEYGKCENQVPGVQDRLSEVPFDPALAQPSLWLNRDLFASRAKFSSKLFENWLVCPSTNSDRGRIDLVVNGQLWGLLDYFERYELLQQFGNGSDQPDQRFKSGYNLRVFTRQAQIQGQGQKPLATYTCLPTDRSSPVLSSQAQPSRNCRIQIQDANNGLGVRAPL